jgi:hypothetical protein
VAQRKRVAIGGFVESSKHGAQPFAQADVLRASPCARGLAQTLDRMTSAKRALVAIVVICAGSVLWVTNRPKVASPFAHLGRPCQAAASQAPLDFPELSATKKKDRGEKMQYLGECNAKQVSAVLWFVSGIHYNNWMREDGRPPVRYEAVVYENVDASDLHVQRAGTQYTTCSVAAEGIDRTRIRYERCGIGSYILEFKKLHAL